MEMQNRERILIIDDEPDTQKILRLTMEKAGYGVMTASDGEGGIRKAEEERPDLIILDVLMPGMTGWETCQKLRQNPLTVSIPIIICTSRSREEDIERGFSAGATDYILKPFELQRVVSKVASALKQTREGRRSG